MIATSPYGIVDSALVAQLEAIVGAANCSTGQSERELHSKDQSMHAPSLPDVVVWVESAEQVSSILRRANARRIPVTAWGVGTSIEGNPIPVHGGILLSFARMNKIIAVHADDSKRPCSRASATRTLTSAWRAMDCSSRPIRGPTPRLAA